ncbi:MAG: hypothetical protein M1830_002093 [Pleopsidium flavum]|nr:MAG: hypothetical protein M1830_002093 [Pleopsidium flavum]
MATSIQAGHLFNVEGLVAVITGGGTGPYSSTNICCGFESFRAYCSLLRHQQSLYRGKTRGQTERGGGKVSKVSTVPDFGGSLTRAPASSNSSYRCQVIVIVKFKAYTASVVVPLPGDVTSQDQLKAIATRVRQEVGYINLLITNAGMSGPMLDTLKPRYTLSDYVEYAWSTPMNEFNETYGLNCTALYYTVLAFLELLDEGNKSGYQGGKSQVIATASTASFLRHPRAGYAYLSSKAAVISLIKTFSTFCVPWGIRFNAIAAGLFPSEIAEVLFKKYIIDHTKSLTQEGVFSRSYQPAERAGSIEDMAGLTLYMASRAGAFINGSVMLADGGKLATMPATY